MAGERSPTTQIEIVSDATVLENSDLSPLELALRHSPDELLELAYQALDDERDVIARIEILEPALDEQKAKSLALRRLVPVLMEAYVMAQDVEATL